MEKDIKEFMEWVFENEYNIDYFVRNNICEDLIEKYKNRNL